MDHSESRFHPVGRAPARHCRLLWRSYRHHAEHRFHCRAGRPLHQRLHAVPDLRPRSRRAGDRAMGAPDASVGQRRPLSWRAAELAPPAPGQRSSRRVVGKLHFRATADDNGFSEGSFRCMCSRAGDLIGMLREPPARRAACLPWPRARARGTRPTTIRSRHCGGGVPMDRNRGEPRGRQAVGAVRVVRATAFPADGAA